MAPREMGKVHGSDISLIDRAFAMEGGYVLNSSNQSFGEFSWEEFDLNVDDPRWQLVFEFVDLPGVEPLLVTVTVPVPEILST